MKTLTVFCLLLVAAPAWAATPASRAIDAYAKPLVDRGDLWGQLLVVRRGEVLVERSWGLANAELGVPVTPETRFNIASVTKPMTVVVALQLFEEKKLGREDRLSRWIPGFPMDDSITVRMLIEHRSGIPHFILPDTEMTQPRTAAEMVDRARRLPLDFAPGTQENYSSGGFEVLARVLELAGGRSYGELVEERIFRPLGMTHTSHPDGRTLLPGRASAYTPGVRGVEPARLADFSALVGAGSVWSTARDLRLFVDGILAGKLGEDIRRRWMRGGRLDFNGYTGGFKAWALVDSASGTEAFFLGNVASGAPDALKRSILKLAAGESVAPPTIPALRATPVTDAEERLWRGVYLLGASTPLRVSASRGALWVNDWVLLPAADGSFFSPRDYGTIRGVAGADGRLARLDWMQGGTPTRFLAIPPSQSRAMVVWRSAWIACWLDACVMAAAARSWRWAMPRLATRAGDMHGWAARDAKLIASATEAAALQRRMDMVPSIDSLVVEIEVESVSGDRAVA